MQQVHALGRLACVFAHFACQLNAQTRENRKPCAFVALAHERSVEVDLRRQRRNGQKARRVNRQERRDSLVEESRVYICSLLQDDDVAPGPFGRPNLPVQFSVHMQKTHSARER